MSSSKHFPPEVFETFPLEPSLSTLVVESYEGEHDQDARYAGEGIAKFKSGDQYIGCFKLGMMHGLGKYAWKDGTIYTGTFRANEVRVKQDVTHKYTEKDELTSVLDTPPHG